MDKQTEKPLKILVVDDDEVDRIAVRRALKTAGLKMQLSEACDYATAIATLKKTNFDCAFLDYRLPDKDGLALLQDLRGYGIKIPLVVLTGQGDEQVAVEMMKAGASDYLPKSKISPEALLRIVRNAIRIYQAERQAELAIQQREQLIRQREDMLSRLTHDLRTPLVAADRMLTLIQDEAFGDISPELEEAIDNMIRNNQNLLNMVNTILEVYRHDAGQKSLSILPCNVCDLVREVMQELTPLAAEKSLTLKLAEPDVSDDKVGMWVMADRVELKRLLVNLVGNAIKFTDTGLVEIRLTYDPLDKDGDAHPPNCWVKLVVSDTGPGIPLEDQARLFERFRQGKHKRSDNGLGLYLARRIVEAHNGTIHVKSQLGEGSTFTVKLPCNAERA